MVAEPAVSPDRLYASFHCRESVMKTREQEVFEATEMATDLALDRFPYNFEAANDFVFAFITSNILDDVTEDEIECIAHIFECLWEEAHGEPEVIDLIEVSDSMRQVILSDGSKELSGACRVCHTNLTEEHVDIWTVICPECDNRELLSLPRNEA